ncbi:MAG: capsular polysaccharide biosynthesis protein CapF [Eubacteriales bacterium]|nr:capsular polysaccharide biosynthesis protein CapF [Eubacteriales bacterium]
MNILITGANGFIGRNLVETLKNVRDGKDKTRSIEPSLIIFVFEKDTDISLLDDFCAKADFVFNLAGVNRPQDPAEFMTGNFGFAAILLDTLKKHNNKCPVMLSSSIQAERDNPYGQSKKAGEELFFQYSKETGAPVYVYRFPNVFGKWCRPNYNSAVATFCHNIANGLPITVNDPDVVINLVYIDDVVDELLRALAGKPTKTGNYCSVPVTHTVKLGEIAKLMYSFKASRDERSVPDMSDTFTSKLYATYLSYLPENEFSYPLKMNCDARGSFTEIIRTSDRGQYSVNISKPGITKGNHWHNTKNEKFIVVSGTGIIRFRKIGDTEVIEYPVSGDKIEVVDIPTGYTHNIENTGDTDMVTVMWANECFDPDKPDTYYEEV